ncbi:MAG: SurA N-terminal domain-containing protein [Nitrospirae bacterium]|nr:SurA N-terminal domain-containing protein [Candidatus Manganitrophaceae bacterium]
MKPLFALRFLFFLFSLFVLFVPGLPSTGFSAQPVERIAATVNGRIIFLSDLDRYQAFFSNPTDTAGDPKKTLDRVIDNRLLQAEAHRFVFQAPTDAEVSQRVKAIRDRFKTEAAYEEALQRTGLSPDELKEETREQLWAERLLQERIYSFVFVSQKEVTRYYQEHLSEFSGKRQEEVEPMIRKKLTDEKRTTKETEYLARLRSHAELQVNLQ